MAVDLTLQAIDVDLLVTTEEMCPTAEKAKLIMCARGAIFTPGILFRKDYDFVSQLGITTAW